MAIIGVRKRIDRRVARRDRGRWTSDAGQRGLAVTLGFAILGLSVLGYSRWHSIDGVAVILATLTLVLVFLWTALSFSRMRELAGASELLIRNEMILEAAGEGIAGTDADGNLTFINPAGRRMIGYASGELTGRSLHHAVHHTKPDGSPYPVEECPMHASLLDGAVHRCDTDVYWRKDGTSFPVEYMSTPIVDRGRIGGAVVVFRDISERRAVQRAKDEFTSVVSHELRTPLTSIRGSLGLLESGVLGVMPERAGRMIQIAVQNTDRLVRLINDILDLERIDAEASHLRDTPCDAAQLIARAAEAMLPTAVIADVELAVDCAPAAFDADADGLIQTLTNLIGNAVKFSPHGGTVQISSQQRDGEMLFTVRDEGRGIPPAQLESIFGRFAQVDSSDSRQTGGTGLGLAICRSIVERHGGRIWATSVIGEGSTFSFVVPATADPAPAAPALLDALEPATGRADETFRVLVVERDPAVAEILADLFRRHGVASFESSDGPETLDLCARVGPDLIVLDDELPDIDGVGIKQWLHGHPHLSALPMTAYHADDVAEAERDRRCAGSVTQMLTKGQISPEEFQWRVMTLLARPRARRNNRAADA